MSLSIAPFDKLWSQLGVERGDKVFIHSNLALAVNSIQPGTAKGVLESLTGCVGTSGTVVLPAFTYSFGKKEIFDPNTDSNLALMGTLSQAAYQMGFYRTRDPMFSVLCSHQSDSLGLLEPESGSSFGPTSTFGKMLDRNYKIVCLGVGLGSTLLHEMEVRLGVRYRYWKQFEGTIRDGNHENSGVVWKTSVRSYDDAGSQADFRTFHRLFESQRSVRVAKVGRRSSFSYRAQDCFSFLRMALPASPNMLIKRGWDNRG